MGSISLLEQIQVTPLKKISSNGGEVWHALKATERSFNGFGEAYFSWVEYKEIKAWKHHLKMTMNLVVPSGRVRFVFCDLLCDDFREECIGAEFYARVTVPPKIWFGFQGISVNPSLVLNLANLPHDPSEVERKSREGIQFNWQEAK